MGEVALRICERCGHSWASRRLPENIKVCPKCKTPYWNMPKKEKEG